MTGPLAFELRACCTGEADLQSEGAGPMNARVRAIAVAGALIAATVGVYGYAAEPGLLEPASAQNCDPN